MALQNPGYGGWEFLELNDAEKAEQRTARAVLRSAILKAGYSEAVANTIELELGKARLTISAEEARTGAGHGLSDGKPFYHLQILARDKSLMSGEDPALYLVLNLVNAKGPSSISMGQSLTWTQDFRSPVLLKMNELCALVAYAGAQANPKPKAEEPKMPSRIPNFKPPKPGLN